MLVAIVLSSTACSVETSAVLPDVDAMTPDSRAPTDGRMRDAPAPPDVGSDTRVMDTMRPDDWWDPAFSRRVRLRFDNSAATNHLARFPVLALLTPSRVDYGAMASDGSDLRFVDEDHTTVLPHEIERFEHGGRSFVWVRVPRIDVGSTTDHVWLYYGNPAASDRQSRSEVWANGYHAVYHLNGADLSDATGTHGAPSTFGDSTAIDGVVGGARRFDGVDDYLDTGCTHQIDQVAVSAWARSPRVPSDTFISGPLLREENYQLTWDHTVAEFRGAASLMAPGWRGASFGPLSADAWYLLGATFDGVRLRAFVDGRLTMQNADVSGTTTVTGHPARIARHAWRSDIETPYFEGDVDEVRIAEAGRGISWMRAEHLSMTDAYISWE
jgi:biopolymer transport protein ExbB